ncbi:hypothetical protein MACH18_23060 [Phaeobacter italicus]|nr:hypothetical protein MACH18_23060 [Phaeobacter italicus]
MTMAAPTIWLAPTTGPNLSARSGTSAEALSPSPMSQDEVDDCQNDHDQANEIDDAMHGILPLRY